MDIGFDRGIDVDTMADSMAFGVAAEFGSWRSATVAKIVVDRPLAEPIGMMVEFVDDNYRFVDNGHAQMETIVDDAEIVVSN